MLHFLESIPKKLFGKRKKAKNKSDASSPEQVQEHEIAVEEHSNEAKTPTPDTPAPLTAPDVKESKTVSFSEEPPRVPRTKKTAFTRRPKTPPPSPEVIKEAKADDELQAMYGKMQAQTVALQDEQVRTSIEPVASNDVAIKGPLIEKESMKDEIVRKAREYRHRTHTHNHYYKGKGKDTYHLQGQALKSVFEDDNGDKLPVAERQKILRELQKGERKHHFR